MPTRANHAAYCLVCSGLASEVLGLNRRIDKLDERRSAVYERMERRRAKAAAALANPSDPPRHCEGCGVILTADRRSSARFCDDICRVEHHKRQQRQARKA